MASGRYEDVSPPASVGFTSIRRGVDLRGDLELGGELLGEAEDHFVSFPSTTFTPATSFSAITAIFLAIASKRSWSC
jgi:hypothetical protein